ncbi:MAG: DUF1223 domain-containing protein [Sphingobacteriales bacterium]|nr:DUF1223 domain-containing protein [Sphingobacteriales bacterium]
MKLFTFILAGACIIALGFTSMNKPAMQDEEIKAGGGSFKPAVLLELFTSEGCSSCPSADRLLPELEKLDSNIITLSFHVDYWNRLGWTDPFSSSEFTERQRDYARQLNLESIYTPQLVVNGKYEMVGSNRSNAETAIKKALQEKSSVSLSIADVQFDNSKVKFIVTANGDIKRSNLLAALVQKKAVMNVRAGENSGAILSHTNIVRAFKSQKANPENEFELNVPKNLATGNWQLVVFSQQQNDLKITGAVKYQPDLK